MKINGSTGEVKFQTSLEQDVVRFEITSGPTKGTKRSALPDFYIGAQAAVFDMDLITRDISRYRTYFPTINLISPKTM